jgi:hypothetical protein
VRNVVRFERNGADTEKAMRDTPHDNLLAAEGYEHVDVFERSARFVTKRNHVCVLDMASAGASERVFTICEQESDAAEIAPLHNSERFFVSSETTLFLLEPDGTVVEKFDIEELADDRPTAEEPPPHDLPPEQINWRLQISRDDAFLFFTWLTTDHSGHWVGRLELATSQVDWCPVRFGAGLAFDSTRSVVFEPEPQPKPGIRVSAFDHGETEFWPTEHGFHQLSLSPSRDRLIASESSVRPGHSTLVVADVDSGRMRPLSFEGTDATWAADGHIWFHGPQSSLWCADSPDSEP